MSEYLCCVCHKPLLQGPVVRHGIDDDGQCYAHESCADSELDEINADLAARAAAPADDNAAAPVSPRADVANEKGRDVGTGQSS